MALDLSHLNEQQHKAVIFGDAPVMVIAGAGCITGDSVINFNRGKKGFTLSIRDAYKHFNQKAKNSSHNWDLELPTYVRSFQGHLIRLHNIKGIVKSGKRVVYKLKLENDYELKATSDHKIMTNEGFIELGELHPSFHSVMCDTNKPKKKETTTKRRDKVVRSLNYHPFGYKDKPGKVRVEEYRLIYEAHINGYTLKDFIKLLRQETIILPVRHDLVFVDPKKYEIHHIDGDWTNNEPDNLVKLTKEDHKKIHKKEQYKCFNQGVPEYVKIKSIKRVGDKMTYDIQCKAPFHNFVANGMVIHNSGKTRVLTYRVAHLLKRGYLPSRLMVTTFTKKASEEMVERLEPLIGETKADRLRIGTFHSLCLRFYKDLREWQKKYEHPKLIMGGGRWMTMVKIINRYSFNKYDNRFATKDIKLLLNKISYWKNEGKRVKDIKKHVKEFNIQMTDYDPKENPHWKFTREGTFVKAYEDYQKELNSQKRIDFDDMLLKPYYELLKPKNEKFLARLRKKIEHILVDEAQDLNKIQFLLVKLLAGENLRITMVGDDYQVLYGFRGARVTEIMEFGKHYNATIIKLEQNYRSTKEIVACGNKLIKYNETQLWKNLFTENEQGMKTKVFLSRNVEEESEMIMEKIQSMILEGYELGDIAILYRTNAQSRAIVDTFIINHVPHKVYSKEGFYDRKEVKDVLAYLRICNHPNMAEPEDFRRIINRPARFLGGKFIDAIEEIMFNNGYETFWQALQRWPDLNLGPTQSMQAKKFVEMVEAVSKRIEITEITTKEILEDIIEETGYLKWMNRELESADEEPDNDTGMNLGSLMVGASRFKNPEEFLLFIDSMEFEENEDDDAVHCLTVHKSKGMEFPIVFIIGCCENVMPHYKADDFEEERRIAYVAVTRAKEELYISTLYEKFNNMNTKPSQFIAEMGAKLPSWYAGYKEDEITKKKTLNKMANNAKRGKFEGTPTFTKYDEKGNVIKQVPVNEMKTVNGG